MTVKVLYKCECLRAEAEVEVPQRPHGGELMLWMGVLTAMIAMDHGTRSPRCRSVVMEYVKIPVTEGADCLGEAPRLN